MGWNVDIDVVVLAKLCIDENESIVAADLERRSGFERRRFNPAMSKLLEFFDYNDISQEIQPDYPAAYVWLSGATRARLRRLIRKAESE